MPYVRIQPAPEQNADIVAQIAKELKAANPLGPEDAPYIREEVLPRSDFFNVTVIWDGWDGLDIPERAAAILDAYRQEKGLDGMMKVASALGLTREEAARRGLLSPA